MKTTTTRRGKIARLPQAIRHQLNTRLRDGQEAGDLLPWLNTLPEVQAILAAHFHSKPILPCNLSRWRQGGYLDWLLLEHATPDSQVRDVMDLAPETIPAIHGAFMDKMALLLASRMLAQLRAHPLATDSDTDAEARLWRELRLGFSALKRFDYYNRKQNREEARELQEIAEKKKKNQPRTREQTRREVARILGIDPDGPRINPETDLFEGPNAEALNKQRARVKQELADRKARQSQPPTDAPEPPSR